MRDGNGDLKQMRRDTFAWFIGMTDAGDDELRLRVQSHREPPAIQVQGGALKADSFYSLQRRALCLAMDGDSRVITIAISPKVACVDPVFEIERAPGLLERVLVDGSPADRASYAWDGKTLWFDMVLNHPVKLELVFAERSHADSP